MNGLIRKMLSLLKNTNSSSKEKITQEHIPALWEDNYCQIEIVPKENLAFIKSEIQQIKDISQKANTGLGFTEAYERGFMNVTTLSKEIRADYLENLLLNFEFKKAKQIQYKGGKIINCEDAKTNAFSISSFTLFFEQKDEFVESIWIEVHLIVSPKEFSLIESFLYSLGEDLSLMLVDWNGLDIIDLTNKREVKRYLIDYWK